MNQKFNKFFFFVGVLKFVFNVAQEDLYLV